MALRLKLLSKLYLVITITTFFVFICILFRTHGGTLEVDPTAAKEVDLMVAKDRTKSLGPYQNIRKEAIERSNSEDFVDDPDVPPLM